MRSSPVTRQRAFTLLEMLVVLVLVSMVTLLLMQGLSYVLNLRVRFVQQLEDLQQGALKAYWFRSSTAALLPDFRPLPKITQNRPAQIFQGTDVRFSGLTLAGLEAEPGVPTAFAWELTYADGMTQLQYHSEHEQTWTLLSWNGRRGGFEYLDAQGAWHSAWPPHLFTQETGAQLPEAIALNGVLRSQPFTWIVRVTGNKNDPYDYRADFDVDNPL